MGGHHSTNTKTVQTRTVDQHNLQDQSIHMDNSHGQNNIHARNVGPGSTIYLLNLQQVGNAIQV